MKVIGCTKGLDLKTDTIDNPFNLLREGKERMING